MIRRLPLLAVAVSTALAVLLAAAAVLVTLQTAPTEPVAAARERVVRLAADVASAVGTAPAAAVPVDLGCPWLGLPGLPASHQVRPRVDVAVPLPGDPAAALDAVARAVRAAGGEVDARAPAGLRARDAAGYRLTVRLDGGLALAVEAPCVWPEGERRPG